MLQLVRVGQFTLGKSGSGTTSFPHFSQISGEKFLGFQSMHSTTDKYVFNHWKNVLAFVLD